MVTMHDVARHAGVSLSTVSYALSGARPVSASTRDRVAAAMAELGFQPNAMARSLASRRSHVIALIYPAMDKGLGGTIAEFVQAAAEQARAFGYHLVLWPFRQTEADQVRDLVRQGMADGVLVMEVALDDSRIDVLVEAGIPYAMIGRTRDVTDRHSVDIDFDATVADAVTHLADLGHRRLGFLNHSQASFDAGYAPAHRARDAFAREIAARGLAGIHRVCDDSPVAGRAAVAEMVAADPALTGLITMNEMATFGVMAELQHLGLRVPDDVSVLGIVTSPGVATMTNPPLTSFHAPGASLGRLAVDRLLLQLAPQQTSSRTRVPATSPAAPSDAAGTLPSVVIPCVLDPGSSTGPAPD